MSGRAGRVYLDFPGVSLYAKMPEEQVDWSLSGRPLLNARPLGDPEKIDALVDTIAQARQPPSASMRIISPHGGERCQTAKQQSARRRVQTSRRTRRRFIRCAVEA